jgi:thiamine kinase-like enzyme
VVHRDPNPTNFVVDGDRAWMVDFGWAVRGPAWMTSANLIVSMMEAGWTAADADDALKAVPAWAEAPQRAVDELARATVREWERVMERGPVHDVWQFRSGIARAWAAHRQTL